MQTLTWTEIETATEDCVGMVCLMGLGGGAPLAIEDTLSDCIAEANAIGLADEITEADVDDHTDCAYLNSESLVAVRITHAVEPAAAALSERHAGRVTDASRGPAALGAWMDSDAWNAHDEVCRWDRCARDHDWHFEHGQLWITCNCGAAWSVVECPRNGYDYRLIQERTS